ncbi:MAG: AbrB family transcriptional regulator [Pseudomonadota bacterium]
MITGFLFLIGTVGAAIAWFINLPMPWLIGSLVAAAFFAVRFKQKLPASYQFPQSLRLCFIAVIGIIIGSTFTTDVASTVFKLWPSLIAVLLYVGTAHAIGYQIFRRVGKYNPVNSLFAAMPGGLVEAVLLGEKAGGDVQLLTLQHFVRVILVVIVVPFLFLIFAGELVGSAGGESFERGEWNAYDFVAMAIIGAVGLIFGKIVRLPAWHLMGPLLASGAFHAASIAEVNSPHWFINLAQLVLGVALGSRFSNMNMSLFFGALKLCVISLSINIGLAALFALALHQIVPTAFDVLFVSFAPGGVTEMSLIALSLGIAPLIVALHHLLRIFATVMLTAYLERTGRFRPPQV